MDIQHHGNWRVAGQLDAGHDSLADVYECPLCFAITRDPIGHGEFHQWTGTEHPYSPRGRVGPSRRRIDVASLALLLVGLISGCLAYWLITTHGLDPLVLVPSVVAATTGARHLTKREAPRC